MITQEAIKKSPNTLEKLVNMSAKMMSEKNTGANIFKDNTLFNILIVIQMSILGDNPFFPCHLPNEPNPFLSKQAFARPNQ